MARRRRRRSRGVELLVLRRRSEREKEIEILLLRHQLRVLERQVVRPQLTQADRALLAAFSRALPRRAWKRSLLVTPATVLRWHRELVARLLLLAPANPEASQTCQLAPIYRLSSLNIASRATARRTGSLISTDPNFRHPQAWEARPKLVKRQIFSLLEWTNAFPVVVPLPLAVDASSAKGCESGLGSE